MRRRIDPKNLLRDLLADPDADAGTDYRDGKGRKAAGGVDAQQAKQKLAHKAAQHALLIACDALNARTLTVREYQPACMSWPASSRACIAAGW